MFERLSRKVAEVAAGLAAVACVGQLAALKAAAGGGPGGHNGFHDVSSYLDNLIGYVMWLAIPAGALGLIAAGGMLMAGNPDGSSWLAKTAVGVGIVLLARGIMA